MLNKLCLILLLSSNQAFSDNTELTAQQWLINMSQAMKTLNYQGTVAFFKNGRIDTMKYFHRFDQGQEQERLVSLNSPMREVVREAGKVSCVFKDSQRLVVNQRPVNESFIVNLPLDFSASTLAYHFRVKGKELVAMRPTRVISIDATDKFRYNRKIWIDQQHFLPLKMEVYNFAGGTLEQVVFTELSVEEKTGDLKAVITKNKIENQAHSEAIFFDSMTFDLSNVPHGFQKVFYRQMMKDKSVDHLLLSDGFSSVSVYKEAKDSDVQLGLRTLGTMNFFTHIVDDFQITAMGEVPAKTVRFIAQGVELR